MYASYTAHSCYCTVTLGMSENHLQSLLLFFQYTHVFFLLPTLGSSLSPNDSDIMSVLVIFLPILHYNKYKLLKCKTSVVSAQSKGKMKRIQD